MKINSEKIKKLMKRKKTTYADLAKKMGLGSRQAAEYRVEQACSLRTISSLARALGVKIDDIIS